MQLITLLADLVCFSLLFLPSENISTFWKKLCDLPLNAIKLPIYWTLIVKSVYAVKDVFAVPMSEAHAVESVAEWAKWKSMFFLVFRVTESVAILSGATKHRDISALKEKKPRLQSCTAYFPVKNAVKDRGAPFSPCWLSEWSDRWRALVSQSQAVAFWANN